MAATMDKMYQNCVIVPFNPQGKRALAPAPERASVLISNTSKRKMFMATGSVQPASVARRNARERNRVKQVNNGFAALRQHIPSTVLTNFTPQGPSAGRGASKKLSKVETLKMAVEYIRSLQQMLEDHEAELKAAEPDRGFYDASPGENLPPQFTYPLMIPTPPSSESSASPTPSHASESSPVFTPAPTYKAYGYDSYEPNSPEDEELLDAIFSWQQTS